MHVGRPVRRPPVVGRVSEWSAQRTGDAGTVVLPACRITRALPSTVEAEVDAVFHARQTMDVPAKYVVPVPGARVVGASGLVVLPDGSLAAESVYGRGVVERDAALTRGIHNRPVRMAGDYFSMLTLWATDGNYYHWLHDTLSRHFAVTEHLPPTTRFIVPADLNVFQRTTLEIVGIPPDARVEFRGDEVWELERLHFAPPTSHSGVDRDEAVAWLRDRILAAFGGRRRDAGRRIYVSRRHAPRRRVCNEDEVERCLTERGFEVHRTEELTFGAQVELFAEARIVVAAHGAGLTNILFAPPGCVVVDMIDPGMLHQAYVYWSLAAALGHDYWYFRTDPRPRPGNQDDAVVPIEKLLDTFARLPG